MKRPVLTFVALFLLSGCAAAPAAYQGKDYSREAPVRLNLAAVLVDTEYQSPGTAPNIEQEMQPSPEDRLRMAISQHYPVLRANRARAAELRFIIKEASVTKTTLPQPEAWLDRVTSDKPEFHYDGRLVIEASASGPGTRRAGFIHAEASRSLEVGHLSPAERERHVQGMSAQMVDDVMAQIDQQLNEHLGGFVYGDGSNDTSVTPQPSGRWDRVMEWK